MEQWRIDIEEHRQLAKSFMAAPERSGSEKRARFHHGLIAQEVAASGYDFGGLQDHSIKGGDDVLSIGYDELIGPLIKAVKELSAEVYALRAGPQCIPGGDDDDWGFVGIC